MWEESEEGWYDEQDTDGKRLTLEELLNASDAILKRRTGLKFREIEEQAWVANTIAVELTLELSCESFKAICNLWYLSLIVGVLWKLDKLKVVQVLVAVPEVVEGLGSSSDVYIERCVPAVSWGISIFPNVSCDSEVPLEHQSCTSAKIGVNSLIGFRLSEGIQPAIVCRAWAHVCTKIGWRDWSEIFFKFSNGSKILLEVAWKLGDIQSIVAILRDIFLANSYMNIYHFPSLTYCL